MGANFWIGQIAAGTFRGWHGWSRIMWQPIRAYPRNQRANQFLRALSGLL
jgi:hypothetical protein